MTRDRIDAADAMDFAAPDATRRAAATGSGEGRDPAGVKPGEAASRGERLALAATILTLLAAMLVPPTVSGVAAKEAAFAILALLAGVAAFAWRSDAPAGRGEDRALLGFCAMAVAALAAAAAARFPDAAFCAVLPYAAMIALHDAALRVLRRERSAVALATCAIAAGVVIAAWGLFGVREFSLARAAGEIGESARAGYLATPFFEHAYLAAQVAAPLAPLALGLLLARPGRSRRLLFAASIAILIAFVIATASRAASLALAAGVAVTTIVHVRGRAGAATAGSARRRRIGILAVAGAVLATGALAWSSPAIAARFVSLLDPGAATSNFERVLLWSDSLRLACDSLPLGIGPGHFGFAIGAYHAAARPLPHAHDQALHVLVELGVLGLFGLVLVIAATLAAARSRSGDPPGPRTIRAGFLGAFVTWLVLAVPETPFAFPAGAAWLAILCGALGAGSIATGKSRPMARRVVPLALACAAFAVGVAPAIRAARAGSLADSAREAMIAGDLAAARAALATAAELAPATPEFHAMRAALEDEAGNVEAALAAWSRHDALTPGITEPLLRVAALENRAGRPERALDYLIRARRRVPLESRLDLDIELATTLHRAGRFESARQIWISLVSRHAHVERPIVMLRLAETLLNLRRERAAAVSLLLAYEAAVGPAEREYPRRLRESIDEWAPR